MIHHFQKDQVAPFVAEELGQFPEGIRHLRFRGHSGEISFCRTADNGKHVGQRTGNRYAFAPACRPRPVSGTHGGPVDILEPVGKPRLAEHQP